MPMVTKKSEVIAAQHPDRTLSGIESGMSRSSQGKDARLPVGFGTSSK